MEIEIKKTNISHDKIKNKILDIDNKFNSKKIIFDKSKHFRYLKNVTKKNTTKYCYCTMIILSNSYMPSILNTGYALKHIAKVKYNTVCFVQDKPHYEDDQLRFEGVSKKYIDDIKKVYDVVIGVDLLKTNIGNKNKNSKYKKNYENILYYCTRSYILGLTQYEKIIYLDASPYILKTIDYIFDKYDISTYRLAFFLNLNRGLNGNFIFITPNEYYFEKSLYLINNYSKVFNNDFYSYFTYDEDIMFYAIYPHWNKITMTPDIFYNLFTVPNYQVEDKVRNKYPVMLNVKLKPFRYPNMADVVERNFFNNDYVNYKDWDDGVNLLVKKYPKFKKYFEYIKTYRYTNFICN